MVGVVGDVLNLVAGCWPCFFWVALSNWGDVVLAAWVYVAIGRIAF